MTHQWTVPPSESGMRLDLFLVAQMPETSRNAIAKSIKAEDVTVNGKTASVHRFLKEGDRVEWHENATKQPAVKAAAVQKHVATLPPLHILEETAAWLVIDKPAGLLVHPDRTERDEGTLVDLLVAHDPGIAKIGDDPERPGIVHRLDKDVSGLMVIAKTQDAFDHLKQQFAQHSVDKNYLALVHGELPHDEGDIKFRIARSHTKARMAARPEHEKEGKAAWTHYTVLKRFNGATLCELKIFSGRTHQIRAHLHGLGTPVMGDTLYTIRQTDRKLQPSRLLLQSVRLSFIDPTTEERKTYTLPPDPAFDQTMALIKPHG